MATRPFIQHNPTSADMNVLPEFIHSHITPKIVFSDHSRKKYLSSLKLGDLNMHSEAHINSLSKKHAALDEKIHNEECRPAPDSTILHELKKEKLVLKDKMVRLRTQ